MLLDVLLGHEEGRGMYTSNRVMFDDLDDMDDYQEQRRVRQGNGRGIGYICGSEKQFLLYLDAV